MTRMISYIEQKSLINKENVYKISYSIIVLFVVIAYYEISFESIIKQFLSTESILPFHM